MKLQTFDKEIIARLMTNSRALDKGIEYMKKLRPGVSDDVARKTAIYEAQETCYRLWLNDSTGWIDSEYKAFSEFVNYVDKGRYFKYSEPFSAKKFLKSSLKRFLIRFLISGAIFLLLLIIGLLLPKNT